MIESVCGLDQFAFFRAGVAFREKADAVIVPALPCGDAGSLHGYGGELHRFHVHRFNRESNFIRCDGRDGQLIRHGERRAAGVVRVEDVIHVGRVELAVLQFHFDGQRFVLIFRYDEFVMHHLTCAGRNLMIIERCEDVLRIATINAIAVAVEHIDV